MTEGVIYDRGYRPYEGERLGRAGGRRAIVFDGIRRVLGLRRKARRKILPWALIAFALLATTIIIGLHFAAGSINEALSQQLPTYPNLFDFYSRIALLFIAVAGPELISPDRAQGVLSVYFSRPLTVADYLGSKAASFLCVAGSIYLVPQLAFHLSLAALSDDGFLGYLFDRTDVLWKVPVVALGYLAVHGGLLAVISSYVKRSAIAAAVFLGTIIAGGNLAGVLADSDLPGARYLSLLAFDQHARVVRDWVFDVDLGRLSPEVAGFEPWVSAVTIAVVAVVGGAWTYRVYRRLA